MELEPRIRPKLINSMPSIEEYQYTEIKDTQSQLNQNTDYHLFSPEALRIKRSLLLSKGNSPEEEQDFRRICLFFSENPNLDPELNEAYQEYIKAYNQVTSLFIINAEESRTNLLIYNTEHETKEMIPLEIPERLDWGSSIAKLPNGELFCFGKFFPPSGIAFIIDNDYRIRLLPSGTPCCLTSIIYFNRNVYCFGGDENSNTLTVSIRFDFDKNAWFKLNPMPKFDSLLNRLNNIENQPESSCNGVLLDRTILISGYRNQNLLLYSIDIDSFSVIPYEFGESQGKILIKVEERLYLFETGFDEKIYESDITNYTTWKRISGSSKGKFLSFGQVPIMNFWPPHAYFTYNKGEIYIGCIEAQEVASFFKFNLDKKVITKL